MALSLSRFSVDNLKQPRSKVYNLDWRNCLIMSIINTVSELVRIDERCQNICQNIIYFVNGKVVRNRIAEDIKKCINLIR